MAFYMGTKFIIICSPYTVVAIASVYSTGKLVSMYHAPIELFSPHRTERVSESQDYRTGSAALEAYIYMVQHEEDSSAVTRFRVLHSYTIVLAVISSIVLYIVPYLGKCTQSGS